MSLETIAARYAQALYEIGVEQSALPTVAGDVRRFADVFSGSAELRGVIDNPLVEDDARGRLLAELATRLSVSPIVKNFLGLLAERRRLVLLPYVARGLEKLSNDRSGTIKATVTTATSMPEAYFASLKDKLERSTGKKIVLERAIDPALLGGVVTQIGDRVIDGSLRTRLARLHDTLLASN